MGRCCKPNPIMTNDNSALITLAGSGEMFSTHFVDKLNEIYLQSKEDIISVINQIDYEKLPLLRIKLYIKLVETFPEFEKFELPTRKEKQNLLDDIYNIGYCLHTKKITSQVKKLLVHVCATDNVDQRSVDAELNTTAITSGTQFSVKTCKKAQNCTDSCKYQGEANHKKNDNPVQCHICQHWFHPSCVGEKEADIVGIWSCTSCRASPEILHKMFEMIMEMQQENFQMKRILQDSLSEIHKKQLHKDKQLQDLSSALAAKSNELSKSMKEITSLKYAITELNSKLNEQTWKNFTKSKNEKTLVIGSSIVRDISESHLEKTDVVCLPGGRIKDVTEAVSQKPADLYDRVVLVVGGNDCNPRNSEAENPASDIVSEYKSLINVSREKAKSVLVSSICPRNLSPDVNSKIDSVNAGLQEMCDEEQDVTFIDNSPSFHLGDGSINDAHYLDDGIHLKYKASNKLSQNLKLKLKDGLKTVCNTSLRRSKQPNMNRKAETYLTSHTDEHPLDKSQDFSHSFWSQARNKSANNHRNSRKQVSLRPRSKRNDAAEYNDLHHHDIRCYNCYEKNHTVRTCRHEEPIVCNTCGAEGHKSKHHSA